MPQNIYKLLIITLVLVSCSGNKEQSVEDLIATDNLEAIHKKKDELVLALVKELELRKDKFKNQIIEMIYFGGGTPSLLTNDQLSLLIDSVYKNYKVSKNPEITLEANPDDLVSVRAQSRTIFEDYLNLGINRLSIGIQSFFEADLKLMNRAHNALEAKHCLEEATRLFENITIDLVKLLKLQLKKSYL